MSTPAAPAVWALRTFTPRLHLPRWIRAILPAGKFAKSAAVQPLAELGAGLGGRLMRPTGTMSASAVPWLMPAFQVVPSVKSSAVGAVTLSVGEPTKELYSNLYVWRVVLYPACCIFLATYRTEARYPGSPELRDG